jgi:hypothetical protein
MIREAKEDYDWQVRKDDKTDKWEHLCPNCKR